MPHTTTMSKISSSTLLSFAFILLTSPLSVTAGVARTLETPGIVRQGTSETVELSHHPDVCGESPYWQFSNDPMFVSRHPIVPCTSHGDCAEYSSNGLTDSNSPWPSCCLHRDCICGSTQVEFLPGAAHCGMFACDSDDSCLPGRCVRGKCSFGNISPACVTDADCEGVHTICDGGVCHFRDPVTGYVTRLNSGVNKNSDLIIISKRNSKPSSTQSKKASKLPPEEPSTGGNVMAKQRRV